MRLQLSSRLVITMVALQLIVLLVLIWNNQRVFRDSYINRLETLYIIEQAHLSETLSIGLMYADRAMLNESLEHLKARTDFSFAVVSDRKGRIMATSGTVPANIGQLNFNISYSKAFDTGLYPLASEISKEGLTLGSIQIGFITEGTRLILENARNQNIVIAAIAILVTLIASMLLGRYISCNIRLLEEGAKNFIKGDYGYRISQVNDNSINDVATSFNLLAENLQQSIESLKERNRLLYESEEQVRLLLNSTAEAIYGLDREGKCTFANPACVELLGYREIGDLTGRNIHELIHHTHLDGTPYPERECPIFLVSRTGEGIHVDDEVFWRADGGHFPVEYWSYPIASNGEITGTVVTFLDITERRHAEESLRRAQKMDAIGQLTGGIAHDFNNLLCIMLGNLDMLEMVVPLDDKGSKYLGSIKRAGERAANLTSKLLGFSRSKASEQTVVDINHAIESMNTLITRALTPEIELSQHFAEDLWLTNIDPGDFEDALLNMCINARDAMDGHGSLTIETRNVALDSAYCHQHPEAIAGDYIEISISDAGSGISKEHLARIFEPFYTTKEEGKGTGLGLAMVFGFIKRSRGCINVYSEPGIGTTFKLYLPRAAGANQQDIKQIEENITLCGGSESILVVDDEAELVELAKSLLEAQGYRVMTASDGNTALEILTSDPSIELLFSDVVMPGGINGYDLAEKATIDNPALKVLLTSGYTKEAMAHNGQSGFDASLLRKPYNLAELVRRVRATLDG